MKKLFAVPGWARSPPDYIIEPLLDPGEGHDQPAHEQTKLDFLLNKFNQSSARQASKVGAGHGQQQPWATLEPAYCPASAPLARKQAVAGAPDLPLSSPARQPDDTPRYADAARLAAFADRTACSVPLANVQQQQQQRLLDQPLLPAFPEYHASPQDIDHCQTSSEPSFQGIHEDTVNVVAARTGEGKRFRRTVSINQLPAADRTAKRIKSMLDSHSKSSGMARAAELAWRSTGPDSAQHSPRSPFGNLQPSIASSGTASSKPQSLLGLHKPEHEPWMHRNHSPASSIAGGLQTLAGGMHEGAMTHDLVPAHGMMPYMHQPMYMPLHPGAKVPLSAYTPHLEHHHSSLRQPSIDRTHDAVNIWRSAVKWVALWLTLSILTIINSIALVIVLENDVFALICAVMFCWSGVLGLVGAVRTLLGHCLAAHHDPEGALEGYHLKMVEILGFTTAALSALAAGAHFVSEQIVTRDMHIPACDKADTRCMEFYNMIIIMMVATTVLYGFHSIVGAVVTFKAHSARRMALAGTGRMHL